MVLGLGLCALVLAANFAGVYVITLLISWNKAFFDALQNVAVEETVRQVGVFFVLILTSAALFLIGQYLRKLVYIRWRRRLNSIALDAWLENQAYWRLQPSILGQLADNPDQRIAEDCRMFVDKLLELSVELITKIVALFTFLLVLWELSSFPLTFSVFDTQIVIPRYMVWAAFLYVALSSWLTHVLGAPLKNLLFLQQRREADYRFALARMRDFSDEIALSRGEAAERRIFD
ncbi:MAG: SbmA/BacA-like family transporter, partial [Pseudomonadota bacterium]